MSTKDDVPDDWNPLDGPAPTEDERAEARALAESLASAATTRRRRADPELGALLDVALRVRATAHPDPPAKTAAIAHAAVEHAMAHAGQRWYRTRWPWLGAAAAIACIVGGVQLASVRDAADDGTPISHPATDVFLQPLGDHPGSLPIDRIADARMRSWRDGLFRARRTP